MIRLRDGLAIVHAAWMAWWSYARPTMERSGRMHDAAQAVRSAFDALDRAVREEVK